MTTEMDDISRRNLSGHSGFVFSTRFESTGRFLYSASIEGVICKWDVETRSLVDQFMIHEGPINDLDCTENRLASVGYDGTVSILSLDGKIQQRRRLSSPLHAVKLLEDGLAYAGRDQTVYVETHNGQFSLNQHTDAIECLSANSQQLLSGSRDSTLCLWDLKEKRLIHILSGHSGWVTQTAFVDTRTAISVGEDGLVIHWDLTTGHKTWEIDTGEPIWGLTLDQAAEHAVIGKAGNPIWLDLTTKFFFELENTDGFACRGLSVSCKNIIALGNDSGGIQFYSPKDLTLSESVATSNQGILTATSNEYGYLTGHQDGSVNLPDASNNDATSFHDSMAYASTRLSGV